MQGERITKMGKNALDMVFSSFAADSLALGAHWIYDTRAIEKDFGRVDRLLKPIEGSFHSNKEAGEFTHYGDQTLVLLETLSENFRFDPALFAQRWFTFMESYEGYMDHATLDTIRNHKKGSSPESSGSASTDLGGASRISPILYLLRNNAHMAAKASREQTALTHNNPMVLDAADFFARVVLKTMDGMNPVSAVERISNDRFNGSQIQEWVRSGLESTGTETRETILRFGQMCDIDAAFPSVIHIISRYEDDLENALIENVMAGGDSAARGMIVGMVLGAYHGTGALPEGWISGMKGFDRIQAALRKIENKK